MLTQSTFISALLCAVIYPLAFPSLVHFHTSSTRCSTAYIIMMYDTCRYIELPSGGHEFTDVVVVCPLDTVQKPFEMLAALPKPTVKGCNQVD